MTYHTFICTVECVMNFLKYFAVLLLFPAFVHGSLYVDCAPYEGRPDNYSIVRGVLLSHRDLARAALGEEDVEGYRFLFNAYSLYGILRKGDFGFSVDDIVSCAGSLRVDFVRLDCEDSRPPIFNVAYDVLRRSHRVDLRAVKCL